MTVTVKDSLKHPHNLFFITAIVLLLISLFQFGEVTDVNFHDTYFVVSLNYVTWALALMFLLGWGVYKLLNRVLLSRGLSWVHVLTTILFLLFLKAWSMILPLIQRSGYSATNRFDRSSMQSVLLMVIVIMFAIGQVAFIVNIVGGVGRYLIKKGTANNGG